MSQGIDMQQNLRESEPGLYDVLHPLVSRWKLLLLGVIVSVILAVIVTSLMQKAYETSIVLTIGTTKDAVFEESATVSTIINSESFQQNAAKKIGLNAPSSALRKMIRAQSDPNRWTANWVSVSILADQPDTAVRLANAVAEGIIERHNAFYDASIQPLKDHQAELTGSIQRISNQLESLRQDLAKTTASNASTELLMQTRIGDGENQLVALRKDLRDSERLMAATHKTSLVSPPLRPVYPAKPNLKLNVLAAALASAFLLTTLILLMDQYRKASPRF